MTDVKAFYEDIVLDTVFSEEIPFESMNGYQACRQVYTSKYFFLRTAWGKLFRKELFAKNRFTVGKLYEDLDLIPRVLYQAEKITLFHFRGYMYRQRSGSIVHASFSLRNFEYVDAIEKCERFFEEQGDRRLAKYTRYRKRGSLADYVIKARDHGLYKTLPKQYKIPLLKAYWYLMVDTLQRGGLKFIFARIGNMFRRYDPKKN